MTEPRDTPRIVRLVNNQGRALRAFALGHIVIFEVPEEAQPWYVFETRRTWLAECATYAAAAEKAREWLNPDCEVSA